MFTIEEIIDIFGTNDNNDIINWVENEEGNFNYGIKGLSFSNTLGDGAICNNSSGNYLSLGLISLILMILLILG